MQCYLLLQLAADLAFFAAGAQGLAHHSTAPHSACKLGLSAGSNLVLRAGSSRDAALFAARILTPHIATYAAVLRAAHSQLSGRPGGMSSKSLLQAVQAEVLEAAAAAAAAGSESGHAGQRGLGYVQQECQWWRAAKSSRQAALPLPAVQWFW
jgi:hypothetical protein